MTSTVKRAGAAKSPAAAPAMPGRTGRPVFATATDLGRWRAASSKAMQTLTDRRLRAATALPGMAFASWSTTGMRSSRAASTGGNDV